VGALNRAFSAGTFLHGVLGRCPRLLLEPRRWRSHVGATAGTMTALCVSQTRYDTIVPGPWTGYHVWEVTATVLGFGLGILDVLMKVRPEKPKPSRCMNLSVDR
jgi:hypothetical protein